MSNLVSPGVSVTVTDSSFYIPATAPTVPLFFVATRAGKFQPDGVTPAAGTNEYGVVETITSLGQSLQMYGVPYFGLDISGNPLHGDARNEYGLFALNQYLNVGNVAYVVRANVDLTDAPVVEIVAGTPTFTGAGSGTCIAVSGTNAVAQTVTVTFIDANNFTTFGTVSGSGGAGVVGALFNNNVFELQITAGSTPFQANDAFTIVFTSQTVYNTLGANDAAKRVTIVQALNAQINGNMDVQAIDTFTYNIIICPGYPEVAENLLELAQIVYNEAFVVSDTPNNLDPADTANWAITSARAVSTGIAYYYPYGLGTNVDGATVFIAASGIALATITYSDNVSEIWRAPAGTTRGLVIGIQSVGIVSGTLGTATTYNQINLNQGQRDILYQYFADINPIVYFPGRGLIVWGAKTSPSAASSLDRIPVSRMVMYIKRALRQGAMPFVFEPNDQITRDNLKAMADALLNDVLVRRGLYDFATISDASNNTPDVIQQNQLWMDVALEPEIDAEFIYIPINILATGAALPGGNGTST